MRLEAGAKAPDFELLGYKLVDGEDESKTYRLQDFAGKNLVLYFYPKDDTPGCTTEAIDFSALAADFAAKNAQVVGVSPDSVEKHKKFSAKHSLSILLLADQEKQCSEAYGAWGEKKNYGKIYQGLIRSTFIIDPQGKIAAAFYNVKAKGHAAKVLETLTST